MWVLMENEGFDRKRGIPMDLMELTVGEAAIFAFLVDQNGSGWG